MNFSRAACRRAGGHQFEADRRMDDTAGVVAGPYILEPWHTARADVAVAVKTAGHFLQRNVVGAVERRGDALGVETAVKTDTLLDVVAGETHDIL